MKKPLPLRKPSDPAAPLVDALVDHEISPRMIRCVICGADTQASSAEQMCWVCRRLKISAWRDVEQQMPAQE